jgi:hypothetical protein
MNSVALKRLAFNPLVLLFGMFGAALIAIAMGSGTANASPEDQTPAPLPFSIQGLELPPQLVELNNIVQQIEQTVQGAVNTVPAVVPTELPPPPPPVASAVFTPEIDQLITDNLPVSLPQLTQEVVDPLYTTGMGLYYQQPASLPTPETMDAHAPLLDQVKAAEALFTVQKVAPDYSACDSNTEMAKLQCGLAIVNENHPGDTPMAEFNLMPRYGFMAWKTSYGMAVGTEYSWQYHDGQIMVSQDLMEAFASDPGNPSAVEWATIIAHEERHHQDDVAMNGMLYPYAEQAHTYGLETEQSADKGAGEMLQNAANRGRITQQDVITGKATIGRLGQGTDEHPEPTHGSKNMREQAVQRGIDLANDGLPSTQADYALVV